MKKAVKRNTSPPTGQREENLSWQPALLPLRRTTSTSFADIRHLITTRCRFQKLKSNAAAMIADHGSIRVSVDYCFSRSCEGDRVNLGPSTNPTSIVEVGVKAVGHRPNTDLDLIRSEHTDDEVSN